MLPGLAWASFLEEVESESDSCNDPICMPQAILERPVHYIRWA